MLVEVPSNCVKQRHELLEVISVDDWKDIENETCFPPFKLRRPCLHLTRSLISYNQCDLSILSREASLQLVPGASHHRVFQSFPFCVAPSLTEKKGSKLKFSAEQTVMFKFYTGLIQVLQNTST